MTGHHNAFTKQTMATFIDGAAAAAAARQTFIDIKILLLWIQKEGESNLFKLQDNFSR